MDLPGIVEQPSDVAVEGMCSLVLPFSDQDVAAVGRHEGLADEAAEVVGAADGRGHGEAAPRGAAWTADFEQDFAWRQAMVLKMRQGRTSVQRGRVRADREGLGAP